MRACVDVFDTLYLSTLSPDRRRAYLRLLSDLDPWLDLAGPTYGDAEALRRFLAGQLDDGYSAATVRKSRAMAKSYFEWGYRAGHVNAATLLAVRALRPPEGSVRQASPRPYRPSELRALRATLDERWPRLPQDEALAWLRRFREGRSPYSRVRVHVIRCQLDASIALALHLGLRRGELFRLRMAHVHGDNEQVVVLKSNSAPGGLDCRLVPFTDAARTAVEAWTTSRWFLGPEHTSPWLSLHAAPTARDAMTRPTFDRLLGTYVGRGWTLKRLRDTCAAGWVRAGLPLEHLRQLLGLSSIEATLPYARLVGGSLEGRMVGLDEHFDELTGPVRITDLAA